MTGHLLWLWLWFFVGALLYMVKRSFYMMTGPNKVADSIAQFVKVAGIPLLFRFAVDSGVYWACFSPQVLESGFEYLGWQGAAYVISILTKFACFAFSFGLGVDPMMDWAIPTVVGKIPFLKDWWPQMPAPLAHSLGDMLRRALVIAQSGTLSPTTVNAIQTALDAAAKDETAKSEDGGR